MGQLLKRARQQRFGVAIQEYAQGRVDLEKATVKADDRHTGWGRCERAGEARARLQQTGRAPVALGDVVQERREQSPVASVDYRQHQLDRHLPPTAMRSEEHT